MYTICLHIVHTHTHTQASLATQMVKNLPAMQKTWVQSLGQAGRSPGGGNSNLENPHGQRSLASYSPWGCKEVGVCVGVCVCV